MSLNTVKKMKDNEFSKQVTLCTNCIIFFLRVMGILEREGDNENPVSWVLEIQR